MAQTKSHQASILAKLIILPPWVSIMLAGLCYAGVSWLRHVYPLDVNTPLTITLHKFPIWLPCVIFVLTAFASVIHHWKRRRLVDEQTGLATLKETSWKEFEILMAEVFQRQGYEVNYSLEKGPDGGVDLVLKKADKTSLVQCKRWKQSAVSVAVVREMFGLLHALKADQVIIVSTGHFTAEARTFAEGKPITLIDGHDLWQLVSDLQGHRPREKRGISPQHAQLPPTSDSLASIKGDAVNPSCPICAGSMVLRQARQGIHAGHSFWGCHRYPRCRGIITSPEPENNIGRPFPYQGES